MQAILGTKDKVQLSDVQDTLILDTYHCVPNNPTVINESDVQRQPGTIIEKQSIKPSTSMSITKADIMKKIVECNKISVKVHEDNADKFLSILKEQNTLLEVLRTSHFYYEYVTI